MKNDFVSTRYWEARYAGGKTSGTGSYGKFAQQKAEVIHAFIREHGINSVLDLGCGDGNQTSLFSNCPNYVGFDVSETVIKLCKKKFKDDSTKVFTNSIKELKVADLTISFEVIFHLLEVDKFLEHLKQLFTFSKQHVIIFSSNEDSRIPQAKHVKHRKFTPYVSDYFPNWRLTQIILSKYSDECFSDFYIYHKESEI